MMSKNIIITPIVNGESTTYAVYIEYDQTILEYIDSYDSHTEALREGALLASQLL